MRPGAQARTGGWPRLRIAAGDVAGAVIVAAWIGVMVALHLAGESGPDRPAAEAALPLPAAGRVALPASTSRYALLHRGRRVGELRRRLEPEGDGYRLEVGVVLRLAPGRLPPLPSSLTARLGPDLALRSFEVSAGALSGRGELKGLAMHIEVSAGAEVGRSTLLLPRPPILGEAALLFIARERPEAGARYRADVFEPEGFRLAAETLEVVGRESLVLGGRRVEALRLRRLAGAEPRSVWVDEAGSILKQDLGFGLVAVLEAGAEEPASAPARRAPAGAEGR